MPEIPPWDTGKGMLPYRSAPLIRIPRPTPWIEYVFWAGHAAATVVGFTSYFLIVAMGGSEDRAASGPHAMTASNVMLGTVLFWMGWAILHYLVSLARQGDQQPPAFYRCLLKEATLGECEERVAPRSFLEAVHVIEGKNAMGARVYGVAFLLTNKHQVLVRELEPDREEAEAWALRLAEKIQT